MIPIKHFHFSKIGQYEKSSKNKNCLLKDHGKTTDTRSLSFSLDTSMFHLYIYDVIYRISLRKLWTNILQKSQRDIPTRMEVRKSVFIANLKHSTFMVWPFISQTPRVGFWPNRYDLRLQPQSIMRSKEGWKEHSRFLDKNKFWCLSLENKWHFTVVIILENPFLVGFCFERVEFRES